MSSVMSTNGGRVRQFMSVMEQDRDIYMLGETEVIEPLLSLRSRLCAEETEELENAVESFFIANDADGREAAFTDIVDGLADLLYVTYGFCHAFGIDPDRIVENVHMSNMTKLCADGRPVYREDGKVIKPSTYMPPDWSGFVDNYKEVYN